MPAARSFSCTARHNKPTATLSTRRLIVAAEGKHGGRSLVVDQFCCWQAQLTGRSCKAAQSIVATMTQLGICLYFWRTCVPTSATIGYNTVQSSRSMAHLLAHLLTQLDRCQKRELLSFHAITSSLQNVGQEAVSIPCSKCIQ